MGGEVSIRGTTNKILREWLPVSLLPLHSRVVVILHTKHMYSRLLWSLYL